MIKSFFRNFVFIFIAIATFTLGNMTSVFAIVDKPTEQIYKVTQMQDGTLQFSSSMPSMRILPWFDGNPGDLSIELGNPFCIAYIAAYSLAMYAGNIKVKIAATAALVAGVSTIYGVSYYKFKDFEICGADWLVWGSYDDAGASALSDIKTHYPELGAFNGSRKYDVIQCTKNFTECAEKCVNRQKCIKTYTEAVGQGSISDDPAFDEAHKTLVSCLGENSCNFDLSFLERDGGRNYLNLNDRIFRERLYNGEEIQNINCSDPREEAKKYDVNQTRVSAGKVPFQHYYMRGYMPGNYACDRFLAEKEKDGDVFDEAYQCCIKASGSICIKDKMSASVELRGERVRFCNSNSQYCTMDEFIFEIFKSKTGEPGKVCARTWSLCPYNFNIQKGTEDTLAFNKELKSENITENGVLKVVNRVVDECYDYANDTSLQCQGRMKNFYQYNRHCTIVEKWIPKPVDNTAYPPFIDKACMNFVGSSHNTTGYTQYAGYEKMFDTYKSFTAPIAECISETMKNFLFNRAGHTKCIPTAGNPNGKPNMYGKCTDGYVYTEGEDLTEAVGIESPTVRLLSFLQSLILVTLVLMMSLFGYYTILNSGKMDRKGMVMLLIKVAIVLSFSASGWWYDQLFRFTYGFSNTFSAITAKMGFDSTMDAKGKYIKYDGCYFGDINDILNKNVAESTPNIEENNYYLYPANRKYVAFFDGLDCKITRYIGYGVGTDAPTLLVFLGASLIWPFNIGIYLAVATFLLAIFVITFAIKAVYIFIASAIGMAVMLYVAPIMIPCILFDKTKGVFNKWLKNLLSLALQPMIMFAFVSVSLTIMDKYVLGDGIYTGSGINRELVCGYSCVSAETGAIIDYTSERSSGAKQKFNNICGADNEMVDIKRNSVACFLDQMTTTPWAALQSFGLFIPLLVDLFLSDVIMFLRVAFLFFILTKVIGTIPGIAGNLTGGRDLPGFGHKAGDPFVGAKRLSSFFDTIVRGGKGVGKNLANKLKNAGSRKKDDEGNEGDEEKRGDLSNINVREQGSDDE